MAHVVAHAIGAPAERQLREISRAEHEGAALVGETKEIIGAQSRLHVLERDVVDGLAFRERVPDVLEHAQRRGLDVDLRPGHAQRLHELPRVGPRGLRSREPRQRESEDVLARQPERIEGPRRHEQRMRGVEPSRDPDHHTLAARRLHALHQPLHLDVEGLVAILVEAQRIVGHERKAVDLSLEARIAELRPMLERDATEGFLRVSGGCGRGVERHRAHALLAQALDIDVGDRHLALRGEALGLREEKSQLVDRRLAVPREIGGALAGPCRRKDIGRETARRLRGAEQRALVRLADHDVGGRQVAEDQRSGERAARRGRGGDPEVLADLGVKDEVREVGCGEEEIHAEGNRGPRERHLEAGHARARREPAVLVVLAIVGQERLGNDTQDRAAREDHRAVVEALVAAHRSPDDADQLHVARGLYETAQCGLHPVEQGVLEQQVVDRIGAQPQLGEECQVRMA